MFSLSISSSQKRLLAPLSIACLVIAVFGAFVSNAALMEERYLLAWAHAAGTGNESLAKFIGYQGFSNEELWGPCATSFLKLTSLFDWSSVASWRIQGIFLHAIAAWLVYKIAWSVTERQMYAVAAAFVFIVYPFNAQAVLWTLGRPEQIAGVLLLLSFFCYQRTHTNWRWLVGALLVYALALLSCAIVWPFSVLFGIYELIDRILRKQQDLRDGTLAIVAPLGFFVLTAAYFAGRGLWTSWQFTPHATVDARQVVRCLQHCFLPVSKISVPGHSGFYRWFLLALAPAVFALPWAVKIDPKLRRLVALAVVWLFLALLPILASATMPDKSHLLYLAEPALAWLALALIASYFLLLPGRMPGRIVAVVAMVALMVFLVSQTVSVASNYRRWGLDVAALEDAIKEEHTPSPYVIVSMLPPHLGLIAAYRGSTMAMFNRATGLMAVSHLSAGRLKDQILQRKHLTDTFKWLPRERRLAPAFDGTPGAAAPHLDAQQIVARLAPSLAHYSFAALDKTGAQLVLRSPANRGPVIRIDASGFTSLGPDFVVIEASIKSSDSDVRDDSGRIELYWTTADSPFYDAENRRVSCPVDMNGRWRLYYLPLRNVGWLTAGQPDYLTLGFPANSEVHLRSIGGATSSGLLPSFKAVPPHTVPGYLFDPPYYGFPTDDALGCYRYPPDTTAVSVSYACNDIPTATGAMVEISMPDKVFRNTNGRLASGVGAALLGVNGKTGVYRLPISYFPSPALYTLRAAAVDRWRNSVSNFSDDIFCLITRPYGTFSLQ